MDINNGGPNGWAEYRRHVLHELQSLHKAVAEIRKDQIKEQLLMHTAIATLKAKSGVWGAIGGFIPVAIILVIWLIKGGADP